MSRCRNPYLMVPGCGLLQHGVTLCHYMAKVIVVKGNQSGRSSSRTGCSSYLVYWAMVISKFKIIYTIATMNEECMVIPKIAASFFFPSFLFSFFLSLPLLVFLFTFFLLPFSSSLFPSQLGLFASKLLCSHEVYIPLFSWIHTIWLLLCHFEVKTL